MTHNLVARFLVNRLKARRGRSFILSAKWLAQKNRLFHPIQRGNVNLAPHLQTGHSIMIRRDAVIVWKFKLTFKGHFHALHATIQPADRLCRNPKNCGIIASAHHSDHVKPFRIRALFCLSSVGRWFQKLY